jgi:hypothetical protein
MAKDRGEQKSAASDTVLHCQPLLFNAANKFIYFNNKEQLVKVSRNWIDYKSSTTRTAGSAFSRLYKKSLTLGSGFLFIIRDTHTETGGPVCRLAQLAG